MWKDWLEYSRAERYGIIVLSLLVVFAAFYPIIHQTLFFKATPLVDADSFYRIDSFFTSLSYSQAKPQNPFSFKDEETPQRDTPELFAFDPNTVSTSELIKLGLSRRQAAVIENYRNKGGVFREPSDIAKIYVIDSALFASLRPYIDIAPQKESIGPDSVGLIVTEAREREKIFLELNSADTLQLVRIKGIGRSYARRIVAYRQMLGGFQNINQITEVFGFPYDLLVSIEPMLWVDTSAINKINLSLTNYQDLRKHPYLSDYQARAIIYYRETMGDFNNLEDIVTNKLVDKETFAKIKPYITIN